MRGSGAEQALSSPDFGTLLRRFRIAANLSQEALAERARISVNGVGSLERGVRRNPRRETLALLSDALELNSEERQRFEVAAALAPDARKGMAVAVGPWPISAVPSLPFALSSFVGRDRELADVEALVRGHRLVTLTGAGGIGKTQTALHVAASIAESDFGPACFVGLAPVIDAAQVVPAIAAALGVQEVPNRLLLDTLTASLRNRTMLLVLDNCEHVIAEAAVAAESFLNGCPRIRILATSREALRSAGEYAYRLPALAFPSATSPSKWFVKDAAAFGAIVLFSDRARATDHRFELTHENAPIVADICRRLDGIPLAIELAAARLSHLPVKAIADKLDDRFHVLTQGSRTALPRQQTMRATIDWSYNLLTPSEQRVFERLSIFSGGCTLDIATSVCGGSEFIPDDVFDALASLIEKSLVTADSNYSEIRYVLFESFRQYGATKLTERGEYDIVARRHAQTYYELASRTGADPGGCADVLPAERIDEELDNWRAALHWTLNDRRDIRLGQQLAAESFGLWRDRSVEGRVWIQSAIRTIDEQTPISLIADLRLAEAFVAWQLWESEAQLAAAEAAVEYYRSAGNSLGIARGQDLAGCALLRFGRFAEAKVRIRDGIERAQDAGDLLLVAFLLRNMAELCQYEHDFEAARIHLANALSIYRGLPKAHYDVASRVAWTISQMATVEIEAGNIEDGLRQLMEFLDAPQPLSSWRAVANALHVVAAYLTDLGRHDEAEKYARKALDLHRQRRLQPATSWLLQYFAARLAYRPCASAEHLHAAVTRAAEILGFVDASLLALGAAHSIGGIAERERLLEVLHASLDPDTLAAHMAIGAAMDEDRAAELALQTVT